jgi:hypothetical protein
LVEGLLSRPGEAPIGPVQVVDLHAKVCGPRFGLHRAHARQRLASLGALDVLTATTTGEQHHRHPIAVQEPQVCCRQHIAVIGMGCHQHHLGVSADIPNRLLKRHDPALLAPRRLGADAQGLRAQPLRQGARSEEHGPDRQHPTSLTAMRGAGVASRSDHLDRGM